MKKFAILVLLLCLALTLVACQPTQPETITLDKLNGLLNDAYSVVEVQAKTTVGEIVLVDNYKFTTNGDKTTVDYTTQRLATFGSQTVNNMIETKQGSATVQNGQVINQTGDVDVDFSNYNHANFNFSEICLSNVNLQETSLSATVTDAQAFLGSAVATTNMTVVANFATYMQSIVVSYTTQSGATVVLTYTFTK